MDIECKGPVDLKASKSRYGILFDCALDMVFLVDTDGHILDANYASIKEYGFTRDDLLSMTVKDLRVPSERHKAETQLKAAFEAGAVYETVHLRKDGSTFPVEISLRGIILDNRNLLIAIVRNATERKRIELESEKTNRALRAISRCNAATIRIREEPALINAICDIFRDVGGYPMAWIGYALNDAGKTVQPMAKTGSERGYIEKAKVTWADTERGRGPAGTAIRTKKPSVVNNIMTSPHFSPWRKDAVEMGYASVIGLPLISDDQAFGVLTIYSDKFDAFDEGEIVLLQELADNLAYGITSIRRRIERDRAEEAHREGEERFRAVFDRAAVGIAVANPDGYLLDSNPVYQTMLGYTREELRQKRIYDVTHPDDVDKSRVFEKQLREGVIDKYQLEKRYVRKDGRVIWGRLNVSAIRNRDGSLKYNLGVAEDITERKNVENAVRESREMLRQVMNNIPQRIFWKDTRSVYLGCNTNFALAAGVGSPNNIVGKTDYDLAWAKAESDAFRKDDREVMDHDRPKYHIIEPQRQADGTQSWLDTNKIPLHDAESNVIGILGTYEDITDRLLAEAQLKDAKAQAELYLDLMGHDFTNMNQALMGNLELMDALTESGEIDRGLIDDSIEIIKRSSRMIGDVKKLTQLQTGKVPRKDVDVSEMLATVKTRYSRVPGRLITINFTPRENCIVRAGDMLEDAFDNLVDNAIRHSAGPITIDLTIHSEQIAGCRYYRITVADTGPGIPDNLKKKLFLTLKESEERAVRRGFGLYLVRTLMDIYHGKVWVEDRVPGDPSRGAKFVILLPAVA